MMDRRKDSAVKDDQRAMPPGLGGVDAPKPGDDALEPLGDVSVENGQRDLQPDIDRPKPEAGDATL